MNITLAPGCQRLSFFFFFLSQGKFLGFFVFHESTHDNTGVLKIGLTFNRYLRYYI